jgi:dTDP-4-dehydrorhamnose reductase
MKILITGSNGLLGQKLVKLLIDRAEDQIIATARGENRLPFDPEAYSFDVMDITNREEVLAVVHKYQPEVIIHTAAMTNVDQCETDQTNCWMQNVDAVSYLIEACQNSGSFLLHLSTDFIFDGKEGPYDEAGIPKPVSYYGESKLAAERLLQDSSIDYAIARTVLVYGIAHDMSRSNIILWVKKSLEEGKEIKVVDDQLRSPTLAEDLAMGCYLIAKKKAKGIFNISGKDLLTPYEMAIKTAEFFGLSTATMERADASSFSQTAMRPPRTGFIIDKAINQLGYMPHSFEEGISILQKQVEAMQS